MLSPAGLLHELEIRTKFPKSSQQLRVRDHGKIIYQKTQRKASIKEKETQEENMGDEMKTRCAV